MKSICLVYMELCAEHPLCMPGKLTAERTPAPAPGDYCLVTYSRPWPGMSQVVQQLSWSANRL